MAKKNEKNDSSIVDRSFDRSVDRTIVRTQISNLKTKIIVRKQPSDDHRTAVRRPSEHRPTTARHEKNCEKRNMSQMIDLVMTINSVQESSKSELSSRGKHPLKIQSFPPVAVLPVEVPDRDNPGCALAEDHEKRSLNRCLFIGKICRTP